MVTPIAAPLTAGEFDRVATFLAQCVGGRAMSFEELDGFFSALIAGPEAVMPSEYWPVALGGNLSEVHAFENLDEVNEILHLFVRHWNTIAATLELGEVYPLHLVEMIDGMKRGTDWATGFMRGVDMRYERWVEMIEHKEHGQALLPMMLLAQEVDPGVEYPPKPLNPEDRLRVLMLMTEGLIKAHRYFQGHRRAFSEGYRKPEPIRRGASKVGRNDPCPCGSGRKFKLCCGGPNAPSVH